MTSKVTVGGREEGGPLRSQVGRFAAGATPKQATNFFWDPATKPERRKLPSSVLLLPPSCCAVTNPRDGSLGLHIMAALPLGGLH